MELNQEGAKPRHYPRIVVNNKHTLTVYYAGGVLTKANFETKKQAEEAVAWIGNQYGRIPHHDIRELL